mgnify:FL=1
MYLRRHSDMQIAFVNPPHADWSLANNMTYLIVQSYYNRFGKYPNQVDWIPAPYKWDKYESFNEVIEEIIDADVIMFSSYAWNYTIIDGLSKQIKQSHPEKILVLGGPHIGTNEPELLKARPQYDYICQPTKPGEPFMEDLINNCIEGSLAPEKIAWELRAIGGRVHDLGKEDYSVYEDHQEYLKETVDYARTNKMEPFIILESTRGCPYKCVFCEWGGGINTKIYKKDVSIVKRDIDAMKKAGYRDAYLTDANFGAFADRDLEIFAYGWNNNFNLTDISTMKAKSLKRRKELVDKWFSIVGTGPEKHSVAEGGTDMWGETEYVSVVPTVSIQSISEDAMKIADRVDLSTEDKLELSRYINERCQEHGFPVPALELILAMPGSTLEDFYNEMEVIWNFQAWGSFRHDYMFLPDSRLNSQEYKDKYDIKTVEVYSDIVDEDGSDNWNSLYKNKKTYFKTISSCHSFTKEEMIEMWFMNNAANYILQNFYPLFIDLISPQGFTKHVYCVIIDLSDFKEIEDEIRDMFDPNTPPRSIRQLGGKFRVDTINEYLERNRLYIISEVSKKCLMSQTYTQRDTSSSMSLTA